MKEQTITELLAERTRLLGAMEAEGSDGEALCAELCAVEARLRDTVPATFDEVRGLVDASEFNEDGFMDVSTAGLFKAIRAGLAYLQGLPQAA